MRSVRLIAATGGAYIAYPLDTRFAIYMPLPPGLPARDTIERLLLMLAEAAFFYIH